MQWLGGEGSEVLTGDSAVLDMTFAEATGAMQIFDVQRAPGASHRAMMSPSTERRSDAEAAAEEVLRSGPPRRYAR